MTWDIDYEKGDFGKLYDADGNFIDRSRRANLMTGEVQQIKMQDGKPVIRNNEVVEVIKTYKAPLRFDRYGG